MIVAEHTWSETNQRYLSAAMDVVRATLERHSASSAADDRLHNARTRLEQAASELQAPAALEVLCRLFDLSDFERDTLLMCAGVELDADFARVCAAAHGDYGRPYPTFGLALAALPTAHWSALLPAAPLRHWRLIDVAGGAGSAKLTSNPLRIDERILHFLAGLQHLDEQLEGLLDLVPRADDSALAPSHTELVERILECWGASRPPGVRVSRTVQLCGVDGAMKQSLAAVASARSGALLYRLSADALPGSAADQVALSRLWEREAALSGATLLLDAESLDGADRSRVTAVARFAERLDSAVVVASREPLPLHDRPARRLDLPATSLDERRCLWHAAFSSRAAEVGDNLDILAAQFNLSPPAIRVVADQALADSHERSLFDAAWELCRVQARSRMDDLARRIESPSTWRDLVLPAAQHQTLREIVAQVRQRATVYERWGFAEKGGRGLGISVLFAGGSGTGKTMAAEVLANELHIDLYQIDLSAVVSKYIGETEKNLRRVFDAAEHGAAILLFDEADALFGRRGEVKDSHDRYANIEVSYLLQRMEAYHGLAILTTNNKSALDPGFLRRMRFVVNFPFPDAVQREEIWRKIFPLATPVDSVDPTRLARLNVAGGNIRNIAFGAAFLAADRGEPVRMAHLLQAAHSEYAKLDKSLTDVEVGGWT